MAVQCKNNFHKQISQQQQQQLKKVNPLLPLQQPQHLLHYIQLQKHVHLKLR
jgi:hypothetical protein